MNFFKVLLTGYYNPNEFIDKLKAKRTPKWGLYATIIRSLCDSLLLYLPLQIIGRTPSIPSYLTFISTEKYYLFSVFMVPVFLVLLWLLLCGIIYLVIRLFKQKTDIDQIMNITGMSSLVVGLILLLWDWTWILSNWNNPYILGFSHLVIDIWGVILITIGFHKNLKLKIWFCVLLNVIWIGIGVLISVIFIRPPI